MTLHRVVLGRAGFVLGAILLLAIGYIGVEHVWHPVTHPVQPRTGA